MVQPDGHGHHEPPVFLTPAAPVDDRREIQIAVRQLELERIVRKPRDARGVEPIGVTLGVKAVFARLLRPLEIAQRAGIKRLIIAVVRGISEREGLGVLVEDILRRMDHVIRDQLVRLPEVAHPVVLAGVEDPGEKVEKIEIELCAALAGIRRQLRHVEARRHGDGAFAVLGKVAEHALAVIAFFVDQPVAHANRSLPVRLVVPAFLIFARSRPADRSRYPPGRASSLPGSRRKGGVRSAPPGGSRGIRRRSG